MGAKMKASQELENMVHEKKPDLNKFNQMANDALYKKIRAPDEIKKMNRLGDNANQAAKILNPKVESI